MLITFPRPKLRTKGDKSLKSLSHLTAEIAQVFVGGERCVVEGGPSQDPHHALEWSFFLSAPSYIYQRVTHWRQVVL
jgi:hypothetical protein